MFKFGKSKKEADHNSAGSIPSSPVTTTPPASTIPGSLSKSALPETAKAPVAVASPKVEANTAPAPASQNQVFQHGLLSFKLLEAKGLKMPPDSNVTPGGPSGKDVGSLPFAVIELDKNEVIMRSVEANPIENTVLFQTKANFDIGRPCACTMSIYIPGPDRKDILIGSVVVKPSFIDQQVSEEWITITRMQAGTETQGPVGEVKTQICFRTSKPKHMTIDDFELLKVIGKGSFGKVMQVRKKETGRIYAMKIIKKAHIVERDEVAHTLAEKTVLTKLNHPFIVPLKYSFQSPEKLYLCLAFVNGGELFYHLQQEGRFSEDRAKFYISELLCSLECLHSLGIIYRDLKPENILLDYTGHIALCDFGLCKLNMKDGNKTNTFCGTPEYLAPEVLIGGGYTKSVDWWTLGILLYEMIGGLPPFYDENVNVMYNKILQDKLTFHDFMSENVIDLLEKLLNRDGNARLGAGGPQEIKAHKFFAQIDWRKLLNRQYAPPFRPNVASAADTSNFDTEFTNEAPTDSLNEYSALSDAVQQQFQGFTFQQTEAIAGSLASGSLMAPSKMEAAPGSAHPSTMRTAGGMRK